MGGFHSGKTFLFSCSCVLSEILLSKFILGLSCDKIRRDEYLFVMLAQIMSFLQLAAEKKTSFGQA